MEAGARAIHVDVMDGHFVPPITIGPVIVEAIRDQVHAAGGMLDCHLMIERPERQIAEFAKAGADSITIQVEATPNVHYALDADPRARLHGGHRDQPRHAARGGLTVRPVVDLVLCMTVNPGWGGQAFIEHSPEKLRQLRKVIGPGVPIQVDGGISVETAPAVKREGASLLRRRLPDLPHPRPRRRVSRAREGCGRLRAMPPWRCSRAAFGREPEPSTTA